MIVSALGIGPALKVASPSPKVGFGLRGSRPATVIFQVLAWTEDAALLGGLVHTFALK